MCLESDMHQANDPGHFADARDLQSPWAKSMLDEMFFYLVGQGIALYSGQAFWEVLHGHRIGVDRRQRFAILRSPSPQEYAGALQ